MKKNISRRITSGLDQELENMLRQMLPELFAKSGLTEGGHNSGAKTIVKDPFGSLSNPIPVNGPFGERKYLANLRGQTGQPVMFHRLGSNFSPVVASPVDTYELVCLDGTQWSYLTFSPYHPYQSNLPPAGFTLVAAYPDTGEDTLVGYGSTLFVKDFPRALPNALRDQFPETLGRQLASAVELALATHIFQQPKSAGDPKSSSATVWMGSDQDGERIKNKNRLADGIHEEGE